MYRGAFLAYTSTGRHKPGCAVLLGWTQPMPGSQIPALTAWVAGQTRRPCPEWDKYIFCLAREAEDTAAIGVLAESAKLKWEHCPYSLIMEKAYKEGHSCPPSPLASRRPLLAAREKATCNYGTKSRHACKGDGYDFTVSFIILFRAKHS